jgi:hypothetical protein
MDKKHNKNRYFITLLQVILDRHLFAIVFLIVSIDAAFFFIWFLADPLTAFETRKPYEVS